MTARGLLLPVVGLGLVAAWLSAGLLVGNDERLIGDPITVRSDTTATPSADPGGGPAGPSVDDPSSWAPSDLPVAPTPVGRGDDLGDDDGAAGDDDGAAGGDDDGDDDGAGDEDDD